jgi:hypothetical protein
MTDPKERLPTPEALDRETRRLARIRHLSIVQEAPAKPTAEPRLVRSHELDPDPKEAA